MGKYYAYLNRPPVLCCPGFMEETFPFLVRPFTESLSTAEASLRRQAEDGEGRKFLIGVHVWLSADKFVGSYLSKQRYTPVSVWTRMRWSKRSSNMAGVTVEELTLRLKNSRRDLVN